jgi:molecular chaperone HscB
VWIVVLCLMSTPNYFEIFSLPRKLNVDTAALETAFYAQSRKLHPDRFVSKSTEEQEAALAQASQLNDAYRTLKEPIARTEYLLSLEGVQMEEQSRAATDAARASNTEKKQVAPPELLEEAFELNMQLEEMRMNKKMGEDDPQLVKDLNAAKTNFEGMLAASQAELASLWNAWDVALDAEDAVAKTAARDKMVALLNRRSYIRNLVRDVNECCAHGE